MSLAVSIVIPSWNGQHLLEQFLPSVFAAAARYCSHAAVEILVVDDGSTDDSPVWLAAAALRAPVPLRVIRHETNLGFGAACNRGVSEASHPLVFLVNNDVEVATDTLAALAAPFHGHPGNGDLLAAHPMVRDFESGRIVGTGKMGGFRRGFLRVHRSYVATATADAPRWSIFATGGSAMFHRARFLDLGGFDLLFAPFYLEDVELSYRAWKRGLTVVFEPTCEVRHRFSSTIDPIARRQVQRVSHRNRLIFHWIHLHDRRYFAAHLFWLAVLIAAAPLTFKASFLGGCADALGQLPAIRIRRRAERQRAHRSDRDIVELFTRFAHRTDVRTYDDPNELSGHELT